MFVLIEGGDAAGKTTLINDLRTEVTVNGVPFSVDNVVFLKSPTPPFAAVWKQIIKTIDPLMRFYLFRTIAQNDSNTVVQLLKQNKDVVLERNFYSTEAFNYTLDKVNGIMQSDMQSMNHINYRGLLKPDLGFFLDVPDNIREQRIQEKERTTGNRSSWEVPEFQTLFNEKLREVAKRENMQFINTDLLNQQQVLQMVITQIQQHKK